MRRALVWNFPIDVTFKSTNPYGCESAGVPQGLGWGGAPRMIRAQGAGGLCCRLAIPLHSPPRFASVPCGGRWERRARQVRPQPAPPTALAWQSTAWRLGLRRPSPQGSQLDPPAPPVHTPPVTSLSLGSCCPLCLGHPFPAPSLLAVLTIYVVQWLEFTLP